MVDVNLNLKFDGQAEEAFNVYKSAFGGEFTSFQRFKEMEGSEIAGADGEKIISVVLPIGHGINLMGMDILEMTQEKLSQGNHLSISISSKDKEEVTKIYNTLSAGGAIEMPLVDLPGYSYYTAFTDKFGIPWVLSWDENKA